jgi:adenylate cyclase
VSRPGDPGATPDPGADVTADDLVELVLGAPRRYTREEAVAVVGLPVEDVRPLWRGMGFADVGEARAFTENDVAGLVLVQGLVDDGVLDAHTAVDVARSFGQTGSRLADWQVSTLARVLTARGLLDASDGLDAGEIATVYREAERLLPAMEQLLVLAWRRHLAATISRAIADADAAAAPETASGVLTVGFADLVGFTRLTRRLPAGELARLVETFESVSSDVVAMTGARLVKTLGDEILFVAEDPWQAAETSLRLHEAHREDDSIPELRIGLATGEVVSRMGDVFGTTVNTASRLTALAAPGTTWCDRATADALRAAGPEAAGETGRVVVHAKALGPRALRGLGMARPYEITGSVQGATT